MNPYIVIKYKNKEILSFGEKKSYYDFLLRIAESNIGKLDCIISDLFMGGLYLKKNNNTTIYLFFDKNNFNFAQFLLYMMGKKIFDLIERCNNNYFYISRAIFHQIKLYNFSEQHDFICGLVITSNGQISFFYAKNNSAFFKDILNFLWKAFDNIRFETICDLNIDISLNNCYNNKVVCLFDFSKVHKDKEVFKHLAKTINSFFLHLTKNNLDIDTSIKGMINEISQKGSNELIQYLSSIDKKTKNDHNKFYANVKEKYKNILYTSTRISSIIKKTYNVQIIIPEEESSEVKKMNNNNNNSNNNNNININSTDSDITTNNFADINNSDIINENNANEIKNNIEESDEFTIEKALGPLTTSIKTLNEPEPEEILDKKNENDFSIK